MRVAGQYLSFDNGGTMSSVHTLYEKCLRESVGFTKKWLTSTNQREKVLLWWEHSVALKAHTVPMYLWCCEFQSGSLLTHSISLPSLLAFSQGLLPIRLKLQKKKMGWFELRQADKLSVLKNVDMLTLKKNASGNVQMPQVMDLWHAKCITWDILIARPCKEKSAITLWCECGVSEVHKKYTQNHCKNCAHNSARK